MTTPRAARGSPGQSVPGGGEEDGQDGCLVVAALAVESQGGILQPRLRVWLPSADAGGRPGSTGQRGCGPAARVCPEAAPDWRGPDSDHP